MKIKISEFQHANVLVVGDVMLDRYLYGFVDCISPEAPVPIVKVNSIEERPGGAANVAMNIASLGAKSHLVGLTGIDDAARILNTKLNSVNVHCDFISSLTYSTITKLRVLSHNQQLIRLDFEEHFSKVDTQGILIRIKKILSQIDVLVLSDYAKGTLNQVQHIIKVACAANIPVLIDPKGYDFKRYCGATLLTPNLSEFEAVVGQCKDEVNLVERGMKLIDNFKLSALLITRSEFGMTLLQPGLTPLNFPAQTQQVFDVTGAGDTVIGVLAATLAIGNSLEDSCFLANAAAGIVIGKLGATSVSPIELESAICGYSESSFGVIKATQLKIAVSQARKRGEKIVMTNGIFDVLHAGHVSYLIDARNLGDRLIVAVNSDASTKRLKGKARPVNTLENRMIVLSALASVDWVVSFEEDTPQNLISDILPDLLVKGGDYKQEDIAGSEAVLENGGEVKILSVKYKLSTTNIITTIKNESK